MTGDGRSYPMEWDRGGVGIVLAAEREAAAVAGSVGGGGSSRRRWMERKYLGCSF
jgi:hypothetical protein